MLGAIIGDIVGSRFEFNNHRSKDFDLFGPGCFATDDSIMTLAVARAILEAEREAQPSISGYEFEGEYSQMLGERTVQCMQSVGRPYPHCGYGGMFAKWMYNDHPKPYNSFGNGAAMRISPVGFAARTEWDVRGWSEAVTAVTHSHPEGIKGAEATAMAIFMARQGCLKSEIRERIVRDYYPLDFTIDQIRPTYRFNETCQETVPQAIECFLESTSFEDAIRTAISLGGDSDTLAAITGAIAEAYYDVPQTIREQALTYLDERLRAIFDEWEAFAGERPEQFHVLTKYIGRIEAETALFDEFYQFNESHPQYQMNNYHDTFAQQGLTWDADSMRRADVSQLDAKVVLALLMGAVWADRINEGALRGFFRDGSIRKWLTRLKDIDRQTGSGKLAEISLNIGGFFGGCNTYQLLFVDRRALLVIGNTMMKQRLKKRYSIHETEQLIARWNDLHTEYWQNEYRLADVCDGEHWTLFVRHEGTRGRVIHGDNAYPENWDALLEFFGIEHETEDEEGDPDGDGDDPGESPEEREHGTVFYCSVFFQTGGGTYYYRSHDPRIAVGDRVIVPVGPGNTEWAGTVEKVERFDMSSVPFPMTKTKKILRKQEEADLNRAALDQATSDDCGVREKAGDAIILCDEATPFVKVKVWAEVRDGCLRVSGQDLGKGAGYVPDEDEYEYFYDFDRENTERLFGLLTAGGDSVQSVLLERFSGMDGCRKLRELCEEQGIGYRFFAC